MLKLAVLTLSIIGSLWCINTYTPAAWEHGVTVAGRMIPFGYLILGVVALGVLSLSPKRR